VIDGQLFAAGPTSTVLTHVAVTFEDVSAAECDDLDGQPIIPSQCNDLGNSQRQPLSSDDGISVCGTKSSPVFPAIKLIAVRQRGIVVEKRGNFYPSLTFRVVKTH
jgi:hypothetical protein